MRQYTSFIIAWAALVLCGVGCGSAVPDTVPSGATGTERKTEGQPADRAGEGKSTKPDDPAKANPAKQGSSSPAERSGDDRAVDDEGEGDEDTADVPDRAAPAAPRPPVEWTTFNYDADNSRNNRSERKISRRNVANLRERWQVSLENGVTSTPIVVDDTVYVGDHGGSLYALEADTGARIWRVSGLFAPRTSTPLVVDDVVYAAGGQHLYARKRSDGSSLWTATLNTHPQTMIESSPTLVGDKIIIGVANYELINSSSNYSGRGAVVALDAANGRELWRWWSTMNNASEGAGVSVWSSAAYDPERNMVFFGTGQGYEFPEARHANSLVAFDADHGDLVWYSQFHGDDVFTSPGGCQGGRRAPRCDFDIGASPNLFRAQGEDVVGVGSKGGLYRVVNRDDGETVWEHQLGSGSWWGGVMAVAATDDDAIYVVNNDYEDGENIFALDKETGESIWETAMSMPVWGAVTVANGVLYVTAKDGILRAFDTDNGDELQTWNVRHDCAGGITVSDGVVYVSSGFTGLGNVSRPGAKVTAFALP